MAESRPIAVPGAAGPVFVAEAPERVRPSVRLIALQALGYLVVDVNQGSLPAILPFLRAAHGLSCAPAATIPAPRGRT